jgi:hypothetical protein
MLSEDEFDNDHFSLEKLKESCQLFSESKGSKFEKFKKQAGHAVKLITQLMQLID